MHFGEGVASTFNNIKAFTLVEVLVTLGIIGIVSALTMPTIISNHQKR
jgi:prepilin-type N-terminal cleavage/methylation domain-containing protein